MYTKRIHAAWHTHTFAYFNVRLLKFISPCICMRVYASEILFFLHLTLSLLFFFFSFFSFSSSRSSFSIRCSVLLLLVFNFSYYWFSMLYKAVDGNTILVNKFVFCGIFFFVNAVENVCVCVCAWLYWLLFTFIVGSHGVSISYLHSTIHQCIELRECVGRLYAVCSRLFFIFFSQYFFSSSFLFNSVVCTHAMLYARTHFARFFISFLYEVLLLLLVLLFSLASNPELYKYM